MIEEDYPLLCTYYCHKLNIQKKYIQGSPFVGSYTERSRNIFSKKVIMIHCETANCC